MPGWTRLGSALLVLPAPSATCPRLGRREVLPLLLMASHAMRGHAMQAKAGQASRAIELCQSNKKYRKKLDGDSYRQRTCFLQLVSRGTGFFARAGASAETGPDSHGPGPTRVRAKGPSPTGHVPNGPGPKCTRDKWATSNAQGTQYLQIISMAGMCHVTTG